MMHKTRRFCVSNDAFEPQAKRMIESDWTLCSGFRTEFEGRDVLFLADGGGEFAVCLQLDAANGGPWVQVESFTMPWMKTPERVGEHLRTTFALVDAGTPPFSAVLEGLTLDEPPETHEPCWACR